MSGLWPTSCRFFFHVRSGADWLEDRVGEYHADAENAHLRALILARELFARWGDHPSCVVIVDDYGHELDVVPIAMAAETAVAAPAA